MKKTYFAMASALFALVLASCGGTSPSNSNSSIPSTSDIPSADPSASSTSEPSVPDPSINTFVITWNNYGGTFLKTSVVNEGDIPSYGSNPTYVDNVYNYTFANWTPEIVAAHENATYTANYTKGEAIPYTITFKSKDGLKTLGTSVVKYSETASDSKIDKTKDSVFPYSYVFANWVTEVGGTTIDDLSNVITDRTVYATFTEELIATSGIKYTYYGSVETPYYGVNGYEGTDTEVVIPNTTDGVGGVCPVLLIDKSAFKDNLSITKIYIGSNVTTIGSYAFANNTKLISAYLGDNTTSIGGNAFYGDTQLVEVDMGDKVSQISSSTFMNCSKLSSIHLSSTIKIIYAYAFLGCSNLVSLTLPASLERVYDSAFEACKKLESITIPKNVYYIGDPVFKDCISLQAINVDAENTNYCSVDGVLYSYDKSVLIAYPANAAATEFSVPATVTEIKRCSFYASQNLETIVIPNSVTTVGEYLFAYSVNLTSVTLSNSISEVPNCAFMQCEKLTNVTFASTSTITRIGEFAFYQCSTLVSIILPDTVTSIEKQSFHFCSLLETINFPEGLLYIGDDCFKECYVLSSVSLPASLASIGADAFYGCKSIATLSVANTNTIYCSDSNALYNYDKTIIYNYAVANKAETIALPSTLVTIKSYCFENASSLTSIIIPSSVTTIETLAFHFNDKLTSIYCEATSKQADWADSWYTEYSTGQITVYYYSSSAPTSAGNYWHYDAGNNPVVYPPYTGE